MGIHYHMLKIYLDYKTFRYIFRIQEPQRECFWGLPLNLGCGAKAENLILSYIIHFISLPIHTPPSVIQKWRKKDKGETHRARENRLLVGMTL